MIINCENCLCSKCDYWKECNDIIYNVNNWCETCHDPDIDRCFTAECDKIKSTNNYLNHPLQKIMRKKRGNLNE